MHSFDPPILFLIFNRPDTTKQVFERIAQIKPKQLFIAADGPRKDRPEEVEKCAQAKEIVKMINWDCQVEHLYRNENLGCRKAVFSAIDWFFGLVEEGIILEDDCLPDLSFFLFCASLLSKYRDNKRIMMISGDNFQDGQTRGIGSYYFSKMAHIWGWATWRRAWNLYDETMQDFPEFKAQHAIQNIWQDPNEQAFWMKNFSATYERKIDTWDYIWVYTIMKTNGLSIMPNTNLISNIGFGSAGTHTINEDDACANMKTGSVDCTSLIHPSFILADQAADSYTHRNHNGIKRFKPPLRERIFFNHKI
jgi:hypothetical protein